MKKQEKNGVTILGSGSIVQQFSNLGLIDQYQIVIVPVVLGEGKSLFENVKKMNLNLVSGTTFTNRLAWLNYEPVK